MNLTEMLGKIKAQLSNSEMEEANVYVLSSNNIDFWPVKQITIDRVDSVIIGEAGEEEHKVIKVTMT